MLGRLLQLPPREQIGLSLACAFVLLVAADHFVVKPVFAELDRMDISIEEKEKALEANLKTLRYKDSIKTQYESIKNLVGVSSSDSEAVDFKGRIDDIALQGGISVKSRRLLPKTPTEFLVTYSLQISGFESEMSALINFLHNIQEDPGLLRLERLTVSSQEENDTVKGTLTVSKAMTLADEGE